MPTKVATRSSLEQIAIIDLMLARPEGATLAELAERMQCCQKTVRRHLSWMRRRFSMRIARVGWEQGANRRWVYPVGQSSIFTKEARRMLA